MHDQTTTVEFSVLDDTTFPVHLLGESWIWYDRFDYEDWHMTFEKPCFFQMSGFSSLFCSVQNNFLSGWMSFVKKYKPLIINIMFVK